MSGRRRLDLELVRRGLATSRTQAQQLVTDGKVLVGGAPADNSARQVSTAEPLNLVGPAPRFVSRGGEKLEAALIGFGIDVTGARVLDVGASTGGFTDCLLQRGAATVLALDVGHGQLHESLRSHDRVEVRERVNVRHVTPDDLGGTFDIITVDVSFISLKTVAPVILSLLSNAQSTVVTLIKPQFEAGRAEVSRGRGIVSDPETWRTVIRDVLDTMSELGAATIGVMRSPILGAQGNVEFLAAFCPQSGVTTSMLPGIPTDLDELVGGAN